MRRIPGDLIFQSYICPFSDRQNKERQLAVRFSFHDKLVVAVNPVQVVKEAVQLLFPVASGNKSIIQ